MRTPRINIEIEFSRAGLEMLRHQIDELLGDHQIADGAGLSWPTERSADRKIGEVWGRVGPNIRLMLTTAAAEWNDGEEFTMTDLADRLETSPKTVRSWHRNLGRTLKQVDQDIPEPSILESYWDGSQNLYKMPAAVRQVIRDRATEID